MLSIKHSILTIHMFEVMPPNIKLLMMKLFGFHEGMRIANDNEPLLGPGKGNINPIILITKANIALLIAPNHANNNIILFPTLITINSLNGQSLLNLHL
jgi:hypothetical protein